VHRGEVEPPSASNGVKVLEAAANSRNPEHAVVFRILAATGCRRGEVCGLQWQDVDLDSAPPTLTIRRSIVDIERQLIVKGTKTHAVRTVGFDAETARMQRDHRKTVVELGLAAGAPVTPTDFVFEREPGSGDPLPRDRVSQAWRRLREQVGVRARQHDVRHLQASLLLDAGEAVTTVAARLGYKDARRRCPRRRPCR
jgi:integrase